MTVLLLVGIRQSVKVTTFLICFSRNKANEGIWLCGPVGEAIFLAWNIQYTCKIHLPKKYMGQVTKVRLSCYLVLLSKPGNKTAAHSWPGPYWHFSNDTALCFYHYDIMAWKHFLHHRLFVTGIPYSPAEKVSVMQCFDICFVSLK